MEAVQASVVIKMRAGVDETELSGRREEAAPEHLHWRALATSLGLEVQCL